MKNSDIMDIHQINKMLDMFMKQMYDVDVWLSENPYSFPKPAYDLNLYVFPSKFLKGSPEFSEKYFNFLSRSHSSLWETIYKAFTYLGINYKELKFDDYIRHHLSSDIPPYLENYSQEFIRHMNNFIELDELLSDEISNVRLIKMEPIMNYSESEIPRVNLRLDYDNTSIFEMRGFLNSQEFRRNFMEYLNGKMKVDPQIDFWFE